MPKCQVQHSMRCHDGVPCNAMQPNITEFFKLFQHVHAKGDSGLFSGGPGRLSLADAAPTQGAWALHLTALLATGFCRRLIARLLSFERGSVRTPTGDGNTPANYKILGMQPSSRCHPRLVSLIP